MLSTSRGRNWHQEAWDFMVLTHNPIITLTINSQQVKEEMCNYFCTKGHVVLPSGEGVRHMVIGKTTREIFRGKCGNKKAMKASAKICCNFFLYTPEGLVIKYGEVNIVSENVRHVILKKSFTLMESIPQRVAL